VTRTLQELHLDLFVPSCLNVRSVYRSKIYSATDEVQIEREAGSGWVWKCFRAVCNGSEVSSYLHCVYTKSIVALRRRNTS